jgi:predicted nuclease of predicted toxin-antitoxin system
VRLLLDTNIVAAAVEALRAAGHDVSYGGEREYDPGDVALLAEAHSDGRVVVTKDHDFGALIHRDGHRHSGVLLIDDLGSVREEIELLLRVVEKEGAALVNGGFLRAGHFGVRAA